MAERFFRPQQFAEYQSQYAGSTVPAFQQAAGALQNRYDQAVAMDDALAAAMENVSALPFQADQEFKTRLLDTYRNRLQQRVEQGDFENMGSQIRRDAQAFAKAAQPLQQRIEQYNAFRKGINEREDIFDITRTGTLQQADAVNRNVGLRDPEAGFVSEAFNPLNLREPVEDINEIDRAVELGKEIKANIIEKGGWFFDENLGVYRNFQDKRKTLTEQDIQRKVQEGLLRDPQLQQSLVQRAGMMSMINGGSPQDYINDLYAGAIKSAGDLFSFSERTIDDNIKFAPERTASAGQEFQDFSNPNVVQANVDAIRGQYRNAFSEFEKGGETDMLAIQLANTVHGGHAGFHDLKRANQIYQDHLAKREQFKADHPLAEDMVEGMLASEDEGMVNEGRKLSMLMQQIPRDINQTDEEYKDQLVSALDAYHSAGVETVDIITPFQEKHREELNSQVFGPRNSKGERTGTGKAALVTGTVLANGVPQESGNLREILEARGVSWGDFVNRATTIGVATPNSTESGGLVLSYEGKNKNTGLLGIGKSDLNIQVMTQNTLTPVEEAFTKSGVHNLEKEVINNLRTGQNFQQDDRGNSFTESKASRPMPIQLPVNDNVPEELRGAVVQGRVVKRAYVSASPQNTTINNMYIVYPEDAFNSVTGEVTGEGVPMSAEQWNQYMRSITFEASHEVLQENRFK